jgi:putative methyltransferase (TIGR04325 family)
MIVEGDNHHWEAGTKFDCLFDDYLRSELGKTRCVLEFGGGGGRHGFEAIKSGRVEQWTIVELPEFIESASGNLRVSNVSFLESIPIQQDSFEISHASNSLQYTSDPLGYLEKIINSTTEWLFLEKLVITTQKQQTSFRQFSLLSEHSPQGFRVSDLEDGLVSYQVSCLTRREVETAISKKFEIVEARAHGPQLHLPLGKGIQMLDLVARRVSL